MNHKAKKPYEKPEMWAIEIQTEAMIATSGDGQPEGIIYDDLD